MHEVFFDQDEVTITIDGVTVYGFPYEGASCSACGQQGYYYQNHDAVFCAQCNVWLEARCRDPEYWYCTTRPANPLPLWGWSSATG